MQGLRAFGRYATVDFQKCIVLYGLEKNLLLLTIPPPIMKNCKKVERREYDLSRRPCGESGLIKSAQVFPEAFLSSPPHICSPDSQL
jgi:hypothetical protein